MKTKSFDTMKIKKLILRILPMMLLTAGSSCALQAQLRANLNCLTFHIPDDTSYVELQYLIFGEGLHYAPIINSETGQTLGYKGCVKAQITFEPTDRKGAIINRELQYVTATYPDASDSNKNNNYNVSRIPLPAGEYTMYLCLSDAFDSIAKPLCYSTTVDLRFDRQKVSASGLQLISAYTQSEKQNVFSKNGLNLIPCFSHFYPSQMDSLTYMWEIYNTDKVFRKGSAGQLESSITAEHGQEAVQGLFCASTVAPAAKHIHFLTFPIDSLPSGNYYLRNKLYAPDGTLILNDSLFFQRSNPALGPALTLSDKNSLPIDTLKQFIDYLYPIAKGDEIDFIRLAKKETDYNVLANFFRYFWEKRNPADPWDAWYRYYGDVKRVNNNYTTLKFKGYKTDRGYYYLKYGAPSDIDYHPIENGLNPYEIWTYYQLDDQTDVYFIFGDLDLNTKNYTMICSNKKDEIYDPRWKFRLKPKDVRPTDIEMTE